MGSRVDGYLLTLETALYSLLSSRFLNGSVTIFVPWLIDSPPLTDPNVPN